MISFKEPGGFESKFCYVSGSVQLCPFAPVRKRLNIHVIERQSSLFLP